MSDQIIVETKGLSGGMVRNIEKAIQAALQTEVDNIRNDIVYHYVEETQAKKNMVGWLDACYKEWQRFTRTYIL